MKILKSIGLLSMLLVVSLVLVACGGNNNGGGAVGEINFKIGTSGILDGSASYGSLLINSHSQLKVTFENQGIYWIDDKPIWERYNQAFFNDKALLLHTFGTSGDYAPDFSVEKIVIENGVLTISFTQSSLTQGDAYFSITILVEVSRSDVSNVTRVEAYIIA